ncbi:MAG: putative peptidoglycan glycosyltransferase FtsW [bacterium]|nr:putative peptidoglycan glycosyltransferase FtsW [bacterium]MDE0418218.1 putative peptidoglycan glycosyltransferase FtsW [bacterium]
MTTFDRTDRSMVARWWWTIDRWNMSALFILMVFGAILILAASPPVAERMGVGAFHFAERQFLFLVPAVAILVSLSLLDPAQVRRAGLALMIVSFVLLIVTLLVAAKTKGAQRWIPLGVFSLQASEFAKPALAITTAWLLATGRNVPGFPGILLSCALTAIVAGLLVLQPDFGTTFIVLAVWGSQLFLGGLPFLVVAAVAVAAVLGLFIGYQQIDYVRDRINGFFDPESVDTYQIEMSLRSFQSGGLNGRGPGEGVIKDHLPDAHSDFIFAVGGEEFGLIACLVLVSLYAFVALRGFVRLRDERDLFVLLAVAGLVIQFAVQAVVNMGVALRLLPTTGMTLPFVSYGGSSLIAMAIGMGLMLALTRRRPNRGRPS